MVHGKALRRRWAILPLLVALMMATWLGGCVIRSRAPYGAGSWGNRDGAYDGSHRSGNEQQNHRPPDDHRSFDNGYRN